MARTATVKLGDAEAIWDGSEFLSEDESVQNVLNSALQAYRDVGSHVLTDEPIYWPDPFMNLAEAIAKYCGGELISIDPPEGPKAPEGAIF